MSTSLDLLIRLIDSLDLANYQEIFIVDNELYSHMKQKYHGPYTAYVIYSDNALDKVESSDTYIIQLPKSKGIWFLEPNKEAIEKSKVLQSLMVSDLSNIYAIVDVNPSLITSLLFALAQLRKTNREASVDVLIKLPKNISTDTAANLVAFIARGISEKLIDRIILINWGRLIEYSINTEIPKEETMKCLDMLLSDIRNSQELGRENKITHFICFPFDEIDLFKGLYDMWRVLQFISTGKEYIIGSAHINVEAPEELLTDSEVSELIRKLGLRDLTISKRVSQDNKAILGVLETESSYTKELLKSGLENIEEITSRLAHPATFMEIYKVTRELRNLITMIGGD